MKTTLISIVALFALAQPASAQTWPSISEWGPGGTINGATSPAYSLPITVIDSIRYTVPAGSQRRTWTRLRNEALAAWQIPFQVQAGAALPSATWTATANTIELLRAEVFYGRGNIQSGAYLSDSGSGVAIISLDKSLWTKYQGLWRSYIAHEVGHALGFGHPYADDFRGDPPNRWVMGDAYYPAADEIAAVRAYYA